MAPALERKHWTVADWEALPDDGKRYEIIDGELVWQPDRVHEPHRIDLPTFFISALGE